MSAPDVEAVCARLTKAQRAAMLQAAFCEASGVWHPAGWYVYADKRVRRHLTAHKITRDYLRRSNRLTPFGELVLARLSAPEAMPSDPVSPAPAVAPAADAYPASDVNAAGLGRSAAKDAGK